MTPPNPDARLRELPARLRVMAASLDRDGMPNAALYMRQAADRIEALGAGLRPFKRAIDDWGDDARQPDRWNIWEHPTATGITLGDLRRARDLVKGNGDAG